MAIKRFCDKCFKETTTGLYRFVVTSVVCSLTDGLDEGAESTLELCAPCAHAILKNANTPNEVQK
jgi:hypothetical protein